MSVVRRHHNSNFTIVPNAIFEDPRLSIEAKGVLGYLLSRPHDWTIRLIHIGATLRVGRDKAERIFQELQDAGYVVRGKQKRVKGTWGPMEFVVFDDPARPSADQSVASLPHPEKPHAVFQGTYKELIQPREMDTRATELSTEALDIADECFRAIGRKTGDLLKLCNLHYEIHKWLAAGREATSLVEAFVHVATNYGDDKPLQYFVMAMNSFLSAMPMARKPRTGVHPNHRRSSAMELPTRSVSDVLQNM
jgi:hypothetical protein